MLSAAQASVRKPSFPSRICVAISASAPSDLFARSAALLPDYLFQELRLDSLASPLEGLQQLGAHLATHPEATFLVTCRPVGSGGLWQASPEAELHALLQAAAAGAPWVDLSLETAEAVGAEAVRTLQQTGVDLVLSWHDFHTAGDLAEVLRRMRAFSPDLRKLVPTAQQLTDNLAIFEQLRHADDGPIVGICMGEAGAASRVLGPRYGSAFTFASPSLADATAPGQLDAATLRALYRIDTLTPATRIYGVAGSPIRSSLSPRMLNTAFQKAGLDAVDLPLLTNDAQQLFRFASFVGLAGCGVTMPLKQAVLPLLSHVDPLAAQIGAVNTLRRQPDGSYAGFNSDAAGITAPLLRKVALRGARVLVLGAGGAARAAVFGCLGEGAEVTLINRTYAKAEALARQSGARALRPEDLSSEPPFDVLIQATPAGMGGEASLPPEFDQVDARLVFDLVYNPLETPLLRAAQARGLDTIRGVEMFLHQGARQFELWTGLPAPIDAMRRTVLEALQSS